jgi:hypothetical protein
MSGRSTASTGNDRNASTSPGNVPAEAVTTTDPGLKAR